MSNDSWYKYNPKDKVWWKESDHIGEWIFSFDKVKEYNLFADYPWKLSAKEKEIFDKEYPNWRDFFADRQK